MNVFDFSSEIESGLVQKAMKLRQPLSGTIELLPLCNMNCKMCYIRLTKAQMETRGSMLSCDQWLRIAEEARDAGLLFLLLTGGEPLLYPKFERLYTELTKMGFIMTLNTNGTLIDEKWADLLATYPIRRLNITLYGTDDETYAKLCGNPKGFTQIEHTFNLLDERGIRYGLNYTVTPENAHQIHNAIQYARDRKVPIDTVDYMFPPMRKQGMNTDSFTRFTAVESARIRLEELKELNEGKSERLIAISQLKKVGIHDTKGLEGPNCQAGRSNFWITWKGELLACGMLTKPWVNLLTHHFKEGWEYLTEEVKKMQRCKKCDDCKYKSLCPSCAAACLTETGSTDGCPEYLCKRTNEMLRLCFEILNSHPGEYDL